MPVLNRLGRLRGQFRERGGHHVLERPLVRVDWFGRRRGAVRGRCDMRGGRAGIAGRRRSSPAMTGATARGACAGCSRTFNGHQNHRPSSAAIDGIMNERTIRVSNSRPSPIVVPTWPTTRRSLTSMEAMVNANTSPAAVTTFPVPPSPG